MNIKSVYLTIVVLIGFLSSNVESAELVERLSGGDESALLEWEELEPSAAIDSMVSAIWRLNRQKSLQQKHPGLIERLGAALAKIPGHAGRIKEHIDGLTKLPSTTVKRVGYFEILGYIGSDEAIEVAGGFLDDDYIHEVDREMSRKGGGGMIDSNSGPALKSLLSMNIVDAPTKKLLRQSDKKLWKEWWKKRSNRETGEMPMSEATVDPPIQSRGGSDNGIGRSSSAVRNSGSFYLALIAMLAGLGVVLAVARSHSNLL